MFRELLQNSDDAQSKEVEIRFETRGFLEDKVEEESPAPTRLPNLKSALVRRIVFEAHIFSIILRAGAPVDV